MNVSELLRKRAESQPDAPAILGPGELDRCSYGSLWAEIEAAAQSLKEAGVVPGDCVGVHIPSNKEYIILTYALWLREACAVPIPMELAGKEKMELCQKIHIDGILSNPNKTKPFASFICDTVRTTSVTAVYLPMKPARAHPDGFHELNPAFLRFTSGTTGMAKGVILSHETVRDRIQAANEALKIGKEDRILWLLSMSYHFTVSIVSYLSYGGAIILCKHHSGDGILEAARRHAATFIYGAPIHYEMMTGAKACNASASLADVRLAISTTTGLREDIRDAFEARFKQPLAQAYGIIEVGLPCIDYERVCGQPNSVGRVLPSYAVRLKETKQFNEGAPLLVKGPGIFDAYYHPFKHAEEVLVDGWFETGDLGVWDANKRLRIVGRFKDIISVAGMKFFPQEVERVLEMHPAIGEACVFARPNRRSGEVPWAQVTTPKNCEAVEVEKLITHCEKHLAAYKVPLRIFYTKSLMKNANGKRVRRHDWILHKMEENRNECQTATQKLHPQQTL